MSSSPLLDWAERQLSRQSDPATSRKAAREMAVVLGERCRMFLDALRALQRATANEVAQSVAAGDHRVYESLRRRASDLHKKGVIREVGARRCTVTGKMATEYEIREGENNVNN